MIDYHTHILPEMDDGSKSVDISAAMIMELKKQGISTIVLTPHFYVDNETVDEFLKRRETSFNLLMNSFDFSGIEFKLGCEVYLRKGISHIDNFQKLCIEDTNYMLLELPYAKLSNSIIDEIENIRYNMMIFPIIAHVDRYFKFLSADDYNKLYAIEDCIFQLNNSYHKELAARFKYKKLLKSFPMMVFGSDCHNMTTRTPNFDIVTDFSLLNRNIELF
ncbi:MAG: CpsB/CapC family capsule biosynthesis tyrosine phosphatase [Oscillospiraceae bacterium]